MSYSLEVKKRRGSDVYPAGSDWQFALVEHGCLKVWTSEKGLMGYTETLYAAGEWQQALKRSSGAQV